VVDFADDTSTELERKAVALKWVSLIETLSYVGLAAFWLTGNKPGTAIFGSLHGMIFLAFAGMVVLITRDMQWGWLFAAIGLVTDLLDRIAVLEAALREARRQGR